MIDDSVKSVVVNDHALGALVNAFAHMAMALVENGHSEQFVVSGAFSYAARLLAPMTPDSRRMIVEDMLRVADFTYQANRRANDAALAAMPAANGVPA